MVKYNYIQEVLSLLLTEVPPINIIKDYFETDSFELQDFCCQYTKLPWSTGIGLIESAENIYKEAVNNGNIKNEEDDR